MGSDGNRLNGSASNGDGPIRRRVREAEHPLHRRVRRTVAFLVPAFAVAGAVAAWSHEGPHSGLRLGIAGVIFLTTGPVALAMARLAPRRLWWRQRATAFDAAVWFILYADVGIAGVLFTYRDYELAMYGTAMFAVVGIYVGFVAGGHAVFCHLAFTSTVIVVLGYAAWQQGDHDLASIVSRALASLLTANASVLVIREFTKDIQRTLTTQVAQAAEDPLTGLLNRRGLATAIDESLADGARVGFLVIDVDAFKSINDDHGHARGDAALVRLAARLLGLAGASSIVARTGGEEFAIAADCRRHDLAELAERVRSAAHDPRDDVPLTVSVGAAVPDNSATGAADSDALIVRGMAVADEAMYEAKAAGGHRVVIRRIS